ncbi:Na+/H+ antiporter NhaA [Nitrospina gracilis]|uniref:Na+/H+ antiporter NhaA n=1 Tax=Nitrospina gracilis TaxID=35801 RepID=UPI001EFFBD89|nr:Na+/H+ antiporter NhaA [Nitrospina gracilis]MCF8721817.1 NhaA family Na+:H+ antiporter [Nitrospina gracilis Nb-211]
MPFKKWWERFFKWEAHEGALLCLTAVLAIGFANSAFHHTYNDFIETLVEIRIGDLEISKPLRIWVNDGLMAVFFLLVGLEIKRETLGEGHGAPSQFLFPAVAAAGGMAVPGLLYAWINWDHPVALKGWAIPTATDIAFALGVLSLFGNRVSANLKMFLLSLAVLDDLGAIVIIALFYTSSLSLFNTLLAGGMFLILVAFNRMGVLRLWPYMIFGFLLWLFLLKSGVHATLAGVMIAFTIPQNIKQKNRTPPSRHLEHTLEPGVNYAILPLFAFVNSGLPLSGLGPDSLADPVTLGILAGLVVGKPLGIVGFTGVAARMGWVTLPEKVTWPQILGVSFLCGIGFTMSLFIGSLAFELGGLNDTRNVRLGILTGSLIAGLLGVALLHGALRQKGKADSGLLEQLKKSE